MTRGTTVTGGRQVDASHFVNDDTLAEVLMLETGGAESVVEGEHPDTTAMIRQTDMHAVVHVGVIADRTRRRREDSAMRTPSPLACATILVAVQVTHLGFRGNARTIDFLLWLLEESPRVSDSEVAS